MKNKPAKNSCNNCRYSGGWFADCSIKKYSQCKNSTHLYTMPKARVSFWRPKGRYLRDEDILRHTDLLYDSQRNKWITVKYTGYFSMKYGNLKSVYPLAIRRPS